MVNIQNWDTRIMFDEGGGTIYYYNPDELVYYFSTRTPASTLIVERNAEVIYQIPLTELSVNGVTYDSEPEVTNVLAGVFPSTSYATAAQAVSSVNGRKGAVTLTKTDVGLDKVNNTADDLKPLSRAATEALQGKSDSGHGHTIDQIQGLTEALAAAGANTGDPSAGGTVTKTTLGLDQVDNTPDSQKPVSQPQQAELDKKANLAGADFTGAVTVPEPLAEETGARVVTAGWVRTKIVEAALGGNQLPSGLVFAVNGKPADQAGNVTLDKANLGLDQVDNTPDAQKPISVAMAAALNQKAAASHNHSTDDISGLDAAIDGRITGKADKSGATFTGAVNVPDITDPATSNGQAANTKFVQAATQAALADAGVEAPDGAPIQNSTAPVQSGGVYTELQKKANLAGGADFTGPVTFPTPLTNDNSIRGATTAWVSSKISGISGANFALNFIHVDDKGAEGDDATDDTTAINSAISDAVAAGIKDIYFGAGKTYRTTGLTAASDITLYLGTATLKLTDAAANNTTNNVIQTPSGAGAEVSGLNISCNRGSNVIGYAGAATLTKGMFLKVYQKTTAYAVITGSTSYFHGWFGIITEIDTVNNLVYLSVAAPETFTADCIQQLTPTRNFHVVGGNIDLTNVVGGTGTGANGIHMKSCVDSSVRACNVFGNKQANGATFAILVADGYNVFLEYNDIDGVNLTAQAKYAVSFNGYNVQVRCNNIKNNYYGVGSAGRAYISSGCLIEGNIVDTGGGSGHAIDMHANTRGVVRRNKITTRYPSTGAISVRGKYSTIDNNEIDIDCRQLTATTVNNIGIGISEMAVDGIKIINNTVRIFGVATGANASYSTIAIGASAAFAATVENMWICNNDVEGDIYFSATSTTFGRGIRINDNTIKILAGSQNALGGLVSKGILLGNASNKFRGYVQRNVFYNDYSNGANACIQIYGAAGSQAFITENMFHYSNNLNLQVPIILRTTRNVVTENTLYVPANTMATVVTDSSTGENFIDANRVIREDTNAVTPQVYTALPTASAWFMGKTVSFRESSTATARYQCVQTGVTTYAWQKIATL